MKLPDFSTFEPFVAIRARMGAEQDGYFAFFDASQQINGEEKARLYNDGLPVSLNTLRTLDDGSLGYKDSRIVLFPQALGDQSVQTNTDPSHTLGHYHLADCEPLKQLSKQPADQWLAAVVDLTRGRDDLKVCSACLQRLRYKDYDDARQRHMEYSRRVLQEFSLVDYLANTACYPLPQQNSHQLHFSLEGLAPDD